MEAGGRSLMEAGPSSSYAETNRGASLANLPREGMSLSMRSLGGECHALGGGVGGIMSNKGLSQFGQAQSPRGPSFGGGGDMMSGVSSRSDLSRMDAGAEGGGCHALGGGGEGGGVCGGLVEPQVPELMPQVRDLIEENCRMRAIINNLAYERDHYSKHPSPHTHNIHTHALMHTYTHTHITHTHTHTHTHTTHTHTHNTHTHTHTHTHTQLSRGTTVPYAYVCTDGTVSHHILLFMCPHTTIHVSSYYSAMCPHTTCIPQVKKARMPRQKSRNTA